MRTRKRNAALIAAGAVIAGLGVGGVLNAQASTTAVPSNDHSVTGGSGDREVSDQGETDEQQGEETADSADEGPDANPNEPGHQDADGSQQGEDGGLETDPDVNTGPDADPSEPGHQDAD